MNKDKAPALSGLLAEMIQATEGIETQWLLWSPYVIGQTIIFLPCDFYLISFFLLFFPRLTSAVGYWMSTILPQI